MDTISRKAAIDIALKYCPDDDGTCSEAGSDIRNMLDEIESLPPAETPMQELLEVTANRDYWEAQCHVYEQEIERIKPKKMHWKTKMSIRHINGAVCYIPKWHCPNCDLEYDSAFAQRVNFCYACGQWIEGLVDDVNEVTE